MEKKSGSNRPSVNVKAAIEVPWQEFYVDTPKKIPEAPFMQQSFSILAEQIANLPQDEAVSALGF